MMPAMVALMVAVHAWAPAQVKTLSLTAVVFMGLLAGVTCMVHFAAPAFSGSRLAAWIRYLMVASGALAGLFYRAAPQAA
jgi:hypothetical protein